MPGLLSVDDACKEAYERQTQTEQLQWTVYKITPDNNIVVESEKARCYTEADAVGKTPEEVTNALKLIWKDFVAGLPENDGRYAVFDILKVNNDNVWKKASNFIFWLPKEVDPETTAIYTTGRDILKNAFSMT